ncbi:hypothetical protein ACQ86N_41910 [Puia sp. P3]|uniref:hypothetical protein n=1 Tax=Puia sp. P3 TaxID=3423952 RepID=UPI003D67BCF4
MGIYIKLDDSKENVVPINLPAEYQQKDINTAVALKIVNTGGMKQLGIAGAQLPRRLYRRHPQTLGSSFVTIRPGSSTITIP